MITTQYDMEFIMCTQKLTGRQCSAQDLIRNNKNKYKKQQCEHIKSKSQEFMKAVE